MTRVVPAAVAMKMEWDKDVEYPPETASRWLSYVRESLTTIYFTPNMLKWYDKNDQRRERNTRVSINLINNSSFKIETPSFLARADQGSVKAPCQYRLAMGSINEGEWFFYAFSYQIQMQFRCNWCGSFRDKDDWKLF